MTNFPSIHLHNPETKLFQNCGKYRKKKLNNFTVGGGKRRRFLNQKKNSRLRLELGEGSIVLLGKKTYSVMLNDLSFLQKCRMAYLGDSSSHFWG